MKHKRMGKAAINKLDPKMLIYCSWAGSDDVMVEDGVEITKRAREVWKDTGRPPADGPTLYNAILCVVAENESGNSFDFVLCTPKGPIELDVDFPEDEK